MIMRQVWELLPFPLLFVYRNQPWLFLQPKHRCFFLRFLFFLKLQLLLLLLLLGLWHFLLKSFGEVIIILLLIFLLLCFVLAFGCMIQSRQFLKVSFSLLLLWFLTQRVVILGFWFSLFRELLKLQFELTFNYLQL